jgi:serine/threonine protein kinase
MADINQSFHRVDNIFAVMQLADFGLSRVLETNATHISTNTIGTIAYQPEEVFFAHSSLFADRFGFKA